MEHTATIFIAASNPMIRSALQRALRLRGYVHCVDQDMVPLDLTDAREVDRVFARFRPDYVFCAGGPSAGLAANRSEPADLLKDNLLVQLHVIDSACRHGVKKLLYLGSSCSYPRSCPPPMKVDDLMTGPLEPTSEPYAMAKLMGLTMVQAYRRQYGLRAIAAIPGDVFGPHDDFSDRGHVLPALMRNIHAAKEQRQPSVSIWGTGTARRFFLYAEDLADACLFLMHHYEGERPINLGGTVTVSIKELAQQLKRLIGYEGTLEFTGAYGDGMPDKTLDVRPLFELGWQPKRTFREALQLTYAWFLEHHTTVANAAAESWHKCSTGMRT
ncbi:MAG: GDP-L-fucose synthase [Nitrospirae bacterium]|nr:MAG: GDP-L-fucose synthase [Nitrospirota bacterium]